MLRPLARSASQLCVISDDYFDRLQRAELERHFRFDANEGPFIERELTQLRAKAFEVQFPESKARRFIPLATDIAPSAMTFEFKVYTTVGAAKVINPQSGDVPRLELGARAVTGRVVPVGIAYAFTIQELREAARIGTPLQTIKPRLARETIERGIDELLAFGDLANTSGQDGLPLLGLANNTDVISAGLKTFSYWMDNGDSGATMLAELSAICDEVSSRSKGLFTCTDLLLPLSRYNYANSKPYSDTIGDSVLSIFRRNHPNVNVQPWEKLETAGVTQAPRAIAYSKSAEVLEAVIPQEFEMMPPERDGFELVTDCWATCGGVKVYQPSGMVYADGATQ
ncbi:MAG TPA: major capsid family protein [Vicinamibacterales bacterium]|nr:major capsid family protein [Vicinamibacterales bacterium]